MVLDIRSYWRSAHVWRVALQIPPGVGTSNAKGAVCVRPDEVLIYLRKRGVSVHLVSHDARGGVTIYLEANLGQMEFAEYLLRRLPGVRETHRAAPGILRATPKR